LVYLIIIDPVNNHMGLGIAATNEFVILVLIVSNKLLTVTNIVEGKSGGV
jgi:hypothetical protein